MKLRRLPILLILLLAIQPLLAMDFPFENSTDYAAAVKQAKKQEKTVLLLFVMTSCGHCQALKKNVLTTDAFQSFAQDSLVPVVYDYQQQSTMLADAKAQMKSLISQHEITGFPAILLISPDEEVLLKSEGYGGSSAATVINLFKERIAAETTAL